MAQGRVTGVHFGNLTPIPHDPELDPPPRACFNCWELGHVRLECPKKPYPGGFCHNCGRADTIMADCLRCGMEYPNWAQRQEAARLAKWQAEHPQEPAAVNDLIDLAAPPMENPDRPLLDATILEILGLDGLIQPNTGHKTLLLLPSQSKLAEAVGRALKAAADDPDRQRLFAIAVQNKIRALSSCTPFPLVKKKKSSV